MSTHAVDPTWMYEDPTGAGDPNPPAVDAELESVAPVVDPYDDDVVALHALGEHVLDGLDPVERSVVAARFGLDGAPVRSMRELRDELGVPKSQLRDAMGTGLAKIRHHLEA